MTAFSPARLRFVRTLGSDQYDRDVHPEISHFFVERKNFLEGNFVLQREHQQNGVDPLCKLPFRSASLVSNHHQITRAVHGDLLLEAAPYAS